MRANQKITLIIFTMVSLLILVIVALVAFGSREGGYKSAQKRADLTAEIVKQSLTAHMINGTMDQSSLFLDRLQQLEGLKDLWIVRAKSVNEQFGDNFQSQIARDDIDKTVLQSGVKQVKTKESLKNASIRITIPYIASAFDKPNCLQCHDAKEGDVLGAISLRFDISDDRTDNMIILLKIIGSALLFMVLFLLFISKQIRPYTKSFDTIIGVLKKVHQGDYAARASGGALKEDKEAFRWLNELIDKLETVLTRIEKNLTAFVHNRSSNVNNDKLLSAKEIIEDIAQIYSYKKTIETDYGKDDIYYRLSQILHDRLQVEDFIIFENDLIKDERTTIYRSKNAQACCEIDTGVRERCRAQRTDTVVISSNFPHLCQAANASGCKEYVCIPFLINDQKSVTVHILCKDEACLKHVKYQIGIIKKYLEETKPILESAMLMDILKERNLVDALTGLYNRKYLDEFIDTKMQHELDEGITYAIMFLDIDYFKMVNDTYGHDAGDAILRDLSKVMKTFISQDDFIIRYGGEEFLIVMRNPTEETAYAMAKKINQEFAKLIFTFNDETFSKTVSIGYSFFPGDADQIWKAIKYADMCLYEAKDQGRNKVIRFDKSLLNKHGGNEY